MKIIYPLLALAMIAATPPTLSDEFSERAVRSYYKAMHILDVCDLNVDVEIYERLLQYGVDLQSRMQVDDNRAQEILAEAKNLFDAKDSSCDIDDDDVAGVMGFVEEQATIIGRQSNLGIRSDEAMYTLTGLQYAIAVSEICEIKIPMDVAGVIGYHANYLQETLAIDAQKSEDLYRELVYELRTSGVDCTPGSEDRKLIELTLKTYNQE